MANKKSRPKRNSPAGVPMTIASDKEVVSQIERQALLDRELVKYPNILQTPPPYARAWLRQHNLEVVYSHGKAKLKFRQ